MSDLKRWNIEEGQDGTALCCKDEHEKGAPCEYEPLTALDAQRLISCVARQDYELTRLQSEVERLVAQEDALWETFIKIADFLGIDSEQARTIPGKPSKVFKAAIIRKQAEAVQSAATVYGKPMTPNNDRYCRVETLLDEVQRLRQQADKLEQSQ